jgi:acyl carrier protein
MEQSTMSNPRDQLRKFLADSLGTNLSDDDDIFTEGGATSLIAFQIVMFMENSFGIALDDADLERDNFTTIGAMGNLVERKLASG